MRPVVLCCSPTPVQASGFPVYSARLCLFMVTTFWGGYFLCVYAMLAVYSVQMDFTTITFQCVCKLPVVSSSIAFSLKSDAGCN